MKELSIEEKAKRYDEILARAEGAKLPYYKENIMSKVKEFVDYLIPELKESEDERIRNRLIAMCKHYIECYALDPYNINGYKEALAWLEKQGKNNMGIFEATKKKLEDNLNKALEKETPESLNEFLEKQGDQKTIKEHNACEFCEDRYGCVSPCSMKLIEEEKPADKVEPKFHEGDWIVHHGTENVYQVVALIDNQYQLKYGDNYTVQKCDDVDRCARLWDITKDAKDGDVLCCKNGWTCIFKTLVNGETFSSYCFMDSTKWFCETGSECHTLKEEFVKVYNGKIYPATKEQRDLLFQKMHEAGYEWNAELKQLKKIEQNPAWSKEDEWKFSDILALLRGGENCHYNNPDLFTWLKNLKDRVQPQPKQEWSDYDECMLANLIDDPHCSIDSEYVHWLKSLKERYSWKPSDEQMLAINTAINVLGKGTINGKYLIELHEQLKKLREE